MSGLLVAPAIMAGLGLFFSVILAVAYRFLKVVEDPRIEETEMLLPGSNCGACGEPGCHAFAEKLVQVAQRSRNLKGHGLDEGMSTRLLVYAGQLIAKGIDPQTACQMTLVRPLTDDPDMRDTLDAAVATYF